MESGDNDSEERYTYIFLVLVVVVDGLLEVLCSRLTLLGLCVGGIQAKPYYDEPKRESPLCPYK